MSRTTTAARKTCTAAQMRDMLIGQAYHLGGPIPCALCFEPILPEHRTIREHMHAIGLDGPDTPDNWRLVHWWCADHKTRGTRATTYGSDIHAIAKGKRLRGETKTGPKAKIQSRGFDKAKRKFRSAAPPPRPQRG